MLNFLRNFLYKSADHLNIRTQRRKYYRLLNVHFLNLKIISVDKDNLFLFFYTKMSSCFSIVQSLVVFFIHIRIKKEQIFRIKKNIFLRCFNSFISSFFIIIFVGFYSLRAFKIKFRNYT